MYFAQSLFSRLHVVINLRYCILRGFHIGLRENQMSNMKKRVRVCYATDDVNYHIIQMNPNKKASLSMIASLTWRKCSKNVKN